MRMAEIPNSLLKIPPFVVADFFRFQLFLTLCDVREWILANILKRLRPLCMTLIVNQWWNVRFYIFKPLARFYRFSFHYGEQLSFYSMNSIVSTLTNMIFLHFAT